MRFQENSLAIFLTHPIWYIPELSSNFLEGNRIVSLGEDIV